MKVIKAIAIGAIVVGTGVVIAALSVGTPAIAVNLIVSGGLMVAQGITGLLTSVERKGIEGSLTSPLASLPIVYGEARLAPRMVELRSRAPDNDLVYWVGAICHGSSDGSGIESIDRIFFDGNIVWQAEGNWTDPKYAGKVTFALYKGTRDQAYHYGLHTDFPSEWPSTSNGWYVCYLVIQYAYDQELFPQGMPGITVDVHGGRCVDPRDIKTITAIAAPSGGFTDLTVPNHGLQATDWIRIQRYEPASPGRLIEGFYPVSSLPDSNTVRIVSSVTGTYVANSLGMGRSVFTRNPMACVFEYMTSPLYGPRGGIPWSEMNIAEFATFAAHCATDVAYSSGAIDWPTHGPRFECNGQADNAFLSDEIIKQLLSSCRGQLVFQNGKWRPFIRRTQTISNPFILDESVIAGAFNLAWPGAESAPNSMRGRFINTQAFAGVQGITFQAKPWFADEKVWPRPTTQPNPMLVLDNNVPSERQQEYPFTCNPYMVELIMMAECREARLAPLISCACYESALACQVGDVVQVVHPTPGYTIDSLAYFWVLGMGLRQDSLVEVVLMPYADAAYAEDALDAHPVPPLNTVLPDATGKPPIPTGMALLCDATTALRLPSGELQNRIKVTFDASDYVFLNHYEFWGNRPGEAIHLLGEALKGDTEFYFPVGADETWSVQMTAVSTLSISSLPNTALQISTPVLGVETVSDNVLLNGDGQGSPAGSDAAEWNYGIGANLKVVSDKAKYGDRSLCFDSTGVVQRSYSSQGVTVAAGEVWEGYGWVHVGGGLGGTGEGAGFYLDCANGGVYSALTVLDHIGSYLDAGGASGRMVYTPRTDVSGEWQFLRLIVKTTAAGILRFLPAIGYNTGCSGKAWFDGLVLHRMAPAVTEGGSWAAGSIDANGNLYVPSTSDILVGSGGTPSGSKSKTVRYPAALLVKQAGGNANVNAAYLYDGTQIPVVPVWFISDHWFSGGVDNSHYAFTGFLFLPKGVRIAAIRLSGGCSGTNATDVTSLQLQKDGAALLTATIPHSTSSEGVVAATGDQPVGDQQYALGLRLSVSAGTVGNPFKSWATWFEIDYTLAGAIVAKTY